MSRSICGIGSGFRPPRIALFCGLTGPLVAAAVDGIGFAKCGLWRSTSVGLSGLGVVQLAKRWLQDRRICASELTMIGDFDGIARASETRMRDCDMSEWR